MNASLLFQTGLIQAISNLVRKGSIPDRDIIRSLGSRLVQTKSELGSPPWRPMDSFIATRTDS